MSTVRDGVPERADRTPSPAADQSATDSASGLSPQNRVELAALSRHLRRAQGFSLAFVVVNHPAVRDQVLRELVDRSGGVTVRLRRDAGGPVPQITAALPPGSPAAVFVVDLETLVDDGPSPALDNLNLNRDFLARRLACPLVVLGPSWLAEAVSRRATDLWSVRSNVFEVVGDSRTGLVAVEEARDALAWEIPPEDRAAKARLLDDLAREADEVGEDDAGYRAALAKARGDAAAMLARYDEAEARYHEALPTFREIGDRVGEANTLGALGEVARMLARFAEAEDRYHEALLIVREIGDLVGEANVLNALGGAAGMLARFDEAMVRHHEALVIFRQIGARAGEANALRALGDAARMLARFGEAEFHYREVLPIYQQIGDLLGEANALKGLGDVAGMLARFDEAMVRYHEALVIFRQIGARVGEANTLQALGDAARVLARFAEAELRYHEALPIFREIGDRVGEANALKALGDAALMSTRYDEAEARYHEALPIFREIGARLGEASILLSFGRLRRVQGQWSEATANLAEAERIYRTIGVERWADVAAGEAAAVLALSDQSTSRP